MWPYSVYARPIGSFPRPYPLPSAEPGDCPCVTVCFNVEWLPFVLGALTQLTLQTTWQVNNKEEFYAARQKAQELINIIAEEGYNPMPCNCGCSGGSGRQYRFDDDGTLQVTDDGGLTWTDAPTSDPRNTGTIFPPLPSIGDSDTDKCRAAMNIVANFQAQFARLISQMQAGEAVIDIIAELIVAFEIYLGVVGVIGALVTQFLAIVVSFGDDAVSAALTEDVWERLTCNIFCQVQEDGTVSNDAINRINAKIDEDEIGISNILLKYMIRVLGSVGLTNVARSGGADGTGCDDCFCVCLEIEEYDATGDDWTGGTEANNGSYTGRWFGAHYDATTVFTIPNRDGRLITGVTLYSSGRSNSNVACGHEVVTAGSQDSDETPYLYPGGNVTHHSFTPAVDDDVISFTALADCGGATDYYMHLDRIVVSYECP